jgi:hypothetical protein
MGFNMCNDDTRGPYEKYLAAKAKPVLDIRSELDFMWAQQHELQVRLQAAEAGLKAVEQRPDVWDW